MTVEKNMCVTNQPLALCLLYFIVKSSGAESELDDNHPIVNTSVGYIQGLKASDGDYFMFLGIPYAKVNASNPFGAAVPQKPFDEIFVASDDSVSCPQIEEYNNTLTGSLDCLNMNIYVPITCNANNAMAVMVYFYGGRNAFGISKRSLLGPKFLVRHNVIIITINYRVGPYGFMCLDTPEVPGNQGLKDQLLALKWTNKNIQSFGGDPRKITLFGISSGSTLVDFHLLAPYEILPHKVILQSGTVFVPYPKDPEKDAPQRLAAHLGYFTTNNEEALAYLTTADPHLVVVATALLRISFNTCIEKQFHNVESFITENWRAQSNIPKVKNMNILIGCTDDESYLRTNVNTDTFQKTLSVILSPMHEDFNEIDEIVRHFYIGDEKPSNENKIGLANFRSDIAYYNPTYQSISRYLNNNAGNIYHYIFSYSGKRNFVKSRSNTTKGGAVHGDELSYIFDMVLFKETPTQDDQLIIDRMTTMWTNFAKYGNPTPHITELLPVRWEPITKRSKLYALNIDKDMRLMTRPFQERMAFWDLFFKTYGKLLYVDGYTYFEGYFDFLSQVLSANNTKAHTQN